MSAGPPQASLAKWVTLHPSGKSSNIVSLTPSVRRRRRSRKSLTAYECIGIPRRPLLDVRGDMTRHTSAHGRVVSRIPQLRRSSDPLFRCRSPRVCGVWIVPAPGSTGPCRALLRTRLHRQCSRLGTAPHRCQSTHCVE